MRRAISPVIALLSGIVLAAPAVAEVSIVVDKTTQRMTVSVNGQSRDSWLDRHRRRPPAHKADLLGSAEHD
jgi:hypothetical protein